MGMEREDRCVAAGPVRQMRWPFVFTVLLHCLWVWKGRPGVRERVYGLERGPWHPERIGF